MAATLVQGFMKLQMDTAVSGGPTWTDVPGVTNVTGGGTSENSIDATDFDTPAGSTEAIPGPSGNNPWSFEMHYRPGDATQEAMFTAEAGNTPKTFRVKGGTKGVTFSAVPRLSLSAQVAGKVMYNGSLQPLAAAVRATIS